MEHREVGVANATEGKILISLSKIEQKSLSGSRFSLAGNKL